MFTYGKKAVFLPIYRYIWSTGKLNHFWKEYSSTYWGLKNLQWLTFSFLFRRWLLNLFARRRPRQSICQSSCLERLTPLMQLADIAMWYEFFTQNNNVFFFPLSSWFFRAFSSGIPSKWTYLRESNGISKNLQFLFSNQKLHERSEFHSNISDDWRLLKTRKTSCKWKVIQLDLSECGRPGGLTSC